MLTKLGFLVVLASLRNHITWNIQVKFTSHGFAPDVYKAGKHFDMS